MSEKIYHIYAKDQCIYHSLKEEEFEKIWKELNYLTELLASSSDISYEELQMDKEISLNSSY
jgi:hypothetical protein